MACDSISEYCPEKDALHTSSLVASIHHHMFKSAITVMHEHRMGKRLKEGQKGL